MLRIDFYWQSFNYLVMREAIDFTYEEVTHNFVPREQIRPSEISEGVIVRFVSVDAGIFRILGERPTSRWAYGYLQHEGETPEHVKFLKQWTLVSDGAVFQRIGSNQPTESKIVIRNIFGLELGVPMNRSVTEKYLPINKV